MNHNLLNTFNAYLDTIEGSQLSTLLNESAKYSLVAGGKRIRPMLLFATLDMFNTEADKGYSVAAAIEMIHTYSLIHDDLPAMDNDDYRRGVLTNHKKFGEATAILAGDALLTDSFSVLMRDDAINSEDKVRLVQLIAHAAGSNGMVGGQCLDMEAENQAITLEQLETIHLHKTGELIRASIVAGGIISEQNEDVLLDLSELGKIIGLLFQVKDDILDIEGTFEETGKAIGSDVNNNKTTYVSLLGIDDAKLKMADLKSKADDLLKKLSGESNQLKELLDFIIERNK